MYNIMIVDDEPIEREAFRLLIKNNFNNLLLVTEAQNGFEAIDLSASLKPDIIVMDIKMPGINGLDATSEIKKKSPYVKFIILSAYNQFDYAQQALKIGAEDFIVKPTKMQALADSINNIIDKLKDEQNKRQIHSVLKNKVEDIKPFVENDMIYSIISGCGEDELRRFAEFLEISFKSCYCMVILSENASDFLTNEDRK